MSEPPDVSPTAPGLKHNPEEAPLRAADFPGCRVVRIPAADIEDHEGRLEYWEARTETAMVCEPVSPHHERPGSRLAGLARLIAASRGAPIETFGSSDLVRFGHLKPFDRLLQADQIVYLDAPSLDELGSKIDVDGEYLPDVVLEVDHTTDVRLRKLAFYEMWGFPEVWVEVPDARSPSRPRSRVSGLTLHILEDGRFRSAATSRAFPGWTASEIHRAFNEPAMSHLTADVLHRVGCALATPDTGPDRDPWLRRYRDESRSEGREEGREEGRVQGREEGRAQGREEGLSEGRVSTVLAVLAARGVATTTAVPALLDERPELDADALLRAALKCRTEAEFLDSVRTAERPEMGGRRAT